ncbi:hypothetical protein [Sphingobium sp. TCM1]|uniref:hypothetical protein n=1 Tax=Sphingobium sp. TCM1 TaxID=453246 RepID=UPI0007F42326|nr:hypothetical protein [Sphingobium sp. TCM1]OAN53338.1 hypothetical protein A7Q26_04740 [Sphingobium sp. TCM1]
MLENAISDRRGRHGGSDLIGKRAERLGERIGVARIGRRDVRRRRSVMPLAQVHIAEPTMRFSCLFARQQRLQMRPRLRLIAERHSGGANRERILCGSSGDAVPQGEPVVLFVERGVILMNRRLGDCDRRSDSQKQQCGFHAASLWKMVGFATRLITYRPFARKRLTSRFCLLIDQDCLLPSAWRLVGAVIRNAAFTHPA